MLYMNKKKIVRYTVLTLALIAVPVILLMESVNNWLLVIPGVMLASAVLHFTVLTKK